MTKLQVYDLKCRNQYNNRHFCQEGLTISEDAYMTPAPEAPDMRFGYEFMPACQNCGEYLLFTFLHIKRWAIFCSLLAKKYLKLNYRFFFTCLIFLHIKIQYLFFSSNEKIFEIKSPIFHYIECISNKMTDLFDKLK